jgi:hypothetical protein
MNVLVLPKRDFGRLAAYVPELRSDMERVMTTRSQLTRGSLGAP